MTELSVRRAPVVAVIPTGDEIRPIGAELKPGELPDTNSLMLAAQATEAGCEVVRHQVVPDDPPRIVEAVREAAAGADLVIVIAGSSAGRDDYTADVVAEADLVIVIAGSSAGRDDYTAEVVGEAGTLAVHGVAVRPGHPVVLGVVAAEPGAAAREAAEPGEAAAPRASREEAEPPEATPTPSGASATPSIRRCT